MEPNQIANVSWNITLCLSRYSLAICGQKGYQMKDMDAKNATILLGPISNFWTLFQNSVFPRHIKIF